tara:strand:+ start:1273 stop:1803 length:531 start_codon:yes stop_codon:yes gene_type:complete
MTKPKRNNQLTAREKKLREQRNATLVAKKPNQDRLPSADGINIIGKITTVCGGKRFVCQIMHTTFLDIPKHAETWKTPDLSIDTEIKAKLKGSIRPSKKVDVGSIVRISYGDTIDFSYTPEEASWINQYAMIVPDEIGDNISFMSDNIDKLIEPDETILVEPCENMNDDQINIDLL